VIHSPSILLRSGIGPARQLASLGIDVAADLPVGEGLQDHPMLTIRLPLRAESSLKTPDDRHTNCCVRFGSGDSDGVANDMMMVALNQSALALEEAETTAGAGAIGMWVNHCYSRGTLSLVSCDPHVQPVVRERMLSDKRDLRRLRQGTRLLAELAASDIITEICGVAPQKANAGLWKALESDDRELDEYLLANVVDTQHGTSTCRMGPADSPSSVVDAQGRVIGVPGLRVADASIFPSVPRANTHLATVVIGEIIADRLT